MLKRVLISIWLLASTVGFGQNRPKVGLALSGGGAKCMAQLGALRAIEESGIKIDYISGTSMGAVIGAMYAMGYTVDEIEYNLAQVDWDQLLTNDLPRNRLPFLTRDDEKYLLSVSLNDGKVVLPKAFNYGHYMLKILSYLTMQRHDVTNFEDLKIPFLCMATDLETGESVLFDKGSLADALRASVAYPSIFSPYEIDGHLYVDGGVRNNLPIAVLKEEKQMDVVIAVDVQGRLYTKDDLNSILDVLEQIGSFPNMLYYEEQKKLADILIYPNIKPYDITSYEATDTLIARGYNATKIWKDQLIQIAVEQQKYLSPETTAPATPLPVFKVDSIAVLGVDPQEARLIQSRLHLKDTGYYTLEKLDRGLDLLYGSGSYEKVQFQYKNIHTKPTAVISVVRKPSRHSFRFGMHYDDDFGIALLANYTLRDFLILNSKFMAEAAISENVRGQVSYLFERGFIPSLGFRFKFNRFQPRVYQNLEPKSQYNLFAYHIDVFLQSTIARNYTIGTGLRYNWVNLSEPIPFLGLESRTTEHIIYHGYLDFDSRNRRFRPQKGFLFQGKANVLWPKEAEFIGEPSSVFTLQYKQALALSNTVGMEFGFNGAATIGGNLDYPFNVFVGGLGENYINFTIPFLGYRFMELIGRNFGSINASLFYEVFENQFFTVKANVGSLEASVSDLFNSSVLLDGYGISYAYNSPIGPLELTVMGSTNHANVYTYISMGYWF